MKGFKKILIARARSFGLTKDNFVRQLSIKHVSFIDPSSTLLLEMMGEDIPKARTNLPEVIEKKCNNNTEVVTFNITEKEYDKLEYVARRHGFTSTGGIGLLLDKVCMFKIIFEKEVKNK